MTVSDYLLSSDPRGKQRGARRVEQRVDQGLPDGLAEADRLIRDLAALVDAGLVVVEPHVLGPARYAVPEAQLEDAA